MDLENEITFVKKNNLKYGLSFIAGAIISSALTFATMNYINYDKKQDEIIKILQNQNSNKSQISKKQNFSEQNFGTIKNPKVQMQDLDMKIMNFDQFVDQKANLIIEKSKTDLEKYTKRLEKWKITYPKVFDRKSYLPSREYTLNTFLKDKRFVENKSKSYISIYEISEKVSSGIPNLPRTPTLFLPPLFERGEHVFKLITGEKIPKINMKLIYPSRIDGKYDPINNEINVFNKDFATTVLTYYSQLGHACYTGMENFKKGDKKEAQVMEEAASHLFTMCCILGTKKINEYNGKRIEKKFMNEHYNHTRRFDPYFFDIKSHGHALAEVILNQFEENPFKAYNYINTKNQYGQLGRFAEKGLKDLRKKLKSHYLKSYSQKYNSIKKKFKNLSKEYQKVYLKR